MLTPPQLDQLDRFRQSAISEIKSMELPDEITAVLRARFNRFLADTVDEIDRIPQSVALVPTVVSHPY